MGDSVSVAGVVADGPGSVSIQTAAPGGREVTVSVPGVSDRREGAGDAGLVGIAGPAGADAGLAGERTRITAATSRTMARQPMRRVRDSIEGTFCENEAMKVTAGKTGNSGFR
jgi:hypothetical protein